MVCGLFPVSGSYEPKFFCIPFRLKRRKLYMTHSTCWTLMWQRSALLEKDGVLYLLNLRSETIHLIWIIMIIHFWQNRSFRRCFLLQLAFQIKDCLQRATLHSNSQVGTIFHEMDTIESPPTYFRTDKFTNAFQEIVDAYGYAHSCKTFHDG